VVVVLVVVVSLEEEEEEEGRCWLLFRITNRTQTTL